MQLLNFSLPMQTACKRSKVREKVSGSVQAVNSLVVGQNIRVPLPYEHHAAAADSLRSHYVRASNPSSPPAHTHTHTPTIAPRRQCIRIVVCQRRRDDH